MNEWLIREGLLVLNEYPTTLTPFDKLNVDWSKTRVWSEGGYYARVFFNVQGREPSGVIPAADFAPLFAAGVVDIFGPGTPIVDAIERVLDRLSASPTEPGPAQVT